MELGEEWVMAEAEDDVRSDEGWVLTDGHGEDERPRCASGVFFRAALRAGFAPFDACARAFVPEPPFPLFPPYAAPCCSAGGLLLLCGPWSAYFVANPSTAQWAALPRPPRAHPRHPVLALVPFLPNYFVVSVVDAVNPGDYSFDVFSAATSKWSASTATARAATRVVPSSGVAVGGSAYWRTEEGLILAYDPEADAAWTVEVPCGPGERWQLGEAGGQLCCARVVGIGVEVRALGPGGVWEPLGLFRLAEAEGWEGQEPPWPLRFQGADPEALLLSGGNVVGVNVSNGQVRELVLGHGVAGLAPEDYVPHINTLAPVLRP